MIVYDQNVSPVWTTWPNITCMTNQLFRGYDALLQYFDPREQTGQCTQAVRVGPMVCASEELRAAGKCENVDDTFQINEAQFEGVTFFDVEPSTEILGSRFE